MRWHASLYMQRGRTSGDAQGEAQGAQAARITHPCRVGARCDERVCISCGLHAVASDLLKSMKLRRKQPFQKKKAVSSAGIGETGFRPSLVGDRRVGAAGALVLLGVAESPREPAGSRRPGAVGDVADIGEVT